MIICVSFFVLDEKRAVPTNYIPAATGFSEADRVSVSGAESLGRPASKYRCTARCYFS